MQIIDGSRGSVTTSDGVSLRYIDCGSGRPMVLIHGGLQTAAQFRKQIVEFSTTHRVIAYDQRGHGDSDKPPYGYRTSRLAKDLYELIESLNLNEVVLLGHSMGCSVIWSYWDLFGADRLAKLVLVDQFPLYVTDPALPSTLFGRSAADLFDVALQMGKVGIGAAADAGFGMNSKENQGWFTSLSDEDREFFLACNKAFPREYVTSLLINQFFSDWRDVLPRISVPTLVIGGICTKSWSEWVSSRIPNAQLEIFSRSDLGSHFMFWENPNKFNDLVRRFL